MKSNYEQYLNGQISALTERAEKAEQARIHVAKAAGGYLDRAEKAEAERNHERELKQTVTMQKGHLLKQITAITQRITQLEAENATLRLEAIPTRQHSDESWRRKVAKLEAALVEAGKALGGLLVEYRGQWWVKANPTDGECDAAGKGYQAIEAALAAQVAHDKEKP